MRIKFKKSDIIIFIILLIIIISYIFLKIFTVKSEPVLLDYATRKSTNFITTIINNSINKIIYESKEKIIEIEKDNNGSIVNLNFNNNAINKMLYLITEDLLKNIKELENGNLDYLISNYITSKDSIYFIPFGVVHDVPILVNIGPKVPFKIDFLGSADDEAKVNIKEYGINSSLVEVVLNINLQMQVILPFKSKNVKISKSIILDNKIVQGQIPNYYGGIISSSLK